MNIFQFDAVDSTMKKACEIFNEDPSLSFFCVLANHQTAGMGTHGRSWDSPVGNFYATYFLRDFQTSPDKISTISIVIGISVVQLLQDLQINIKLKWCNDLLIDLQKVGGILCQINNNNLHIGIGINFKHKPSYCKQSSFFIPSIIPIDIPISYVRFAKELGKKILDNLEILNNRGFAYFSHLWNTYSALYKRKLLLTLPDESQIIGIDQGINYDGCLLIQLQKGIECFYSARISRVLEN